MSSRNEPTAAARPTKFHQRSTEAAGGVAACSCPIHGGREREVFTAPLGKSFASEVSIRQIDREEAEKLYEQHHGYMDYVPQVNFCHHDITYQSETMGAVTWRMPFMSKKKIHLSADGTPIPAPASADDIRAALPERYHHTALDVLNLDRTEDNEAAEIPVVPGDKFAEAARICIGVDFPNLASCGLAHSQQRFVDDRAKDDGIDYLLTRVRSDFDGTMLRALRDRGWRCVGWSEPSQASNREDRGIRDRWKWNFLCPVDVVVAQQSLGEWA